MGIIERCPICDEAVVIIATPIDYANKNLRVWAHEECLKKTFKGGWRVGRIERRRGNKISIEYLCEHDIGHWEWPHGCDRCCLREDYPGK